MTFENLSCEQTEAVATVTVSRPKVLNALNAATIQELGDCLVRLRDDTSVRAIVLTGEGDRGVHRRCRHCRVVTVDANGGA